MLNARKLIFEQKIAFKKNLGHYALLFFSLGFAVQSLQAEELVTQKNAIAQEIMGIITAKQHPYLKLSNFQNRAEDLDKLYKPMNYQLLWLGNKHSEKNIAEALHLLADSSVHGLNPANYDSGTLKQHLISAAKPGADADKRAALYDSALSLSVLRFLHDLQYGRVNPQGINFKLKPREKMPVDLPALIKDALTQGTIAQLAFLAEPKLKQYQRMKKALALYRRLAVESPDLKLIIDQPLRPGGTLPNADKLIKFLTVVGDLPKENADDNAQKSSLYSEKLVAGVKKFQARHGLSADGVIGRETLAALNVPLRQRITQIELAMERLRWLPKLSADPYIIVNIPAYQLWAANDIEKITTDILSMKVVVGKALENQTPVLMAEMRFIDFMPYWNIPYSIVKNELLPKLMQNPGYLAQENIELVTRFGNEVKAVPFSESSIAQLKQGTLKARQRPGAKNALGRVKFIFPNQDDVYLHDTSANTLFGKSRRDFSHGCVRVENPEQLAEFVLKNQTQWSKETIQEAMQNPKTQRVILEKPVPVLFYYATSFFDQNDNLAFYTDIYGHDAVLQAALAKPEDLSDQSLFISKSPEPAPAVIVR